LQILNPQIEPISTFENEEGKFFRSFLISTKENDANWFIRKETGHEKVKSAIQKDFAIIPELIQKPISQGGGGHVKGTREQILKGYADNSHGKIVKVLGPFYYQDNSGDYWYDQITKLSNSRSASILHNEGLKTWNGYDVSPHVFVNKGSDAAGWEDWEFAGLNLVIRGAYGPQAIITKFCDGSESKCFKDLMASTMNTNDETIAEILTSHLSKIASTPHSMPDQPPAKPDTGIPDAGLTNKDKTNPTTDPQKNLTTSPKVENESVSISAEELKALKERAESFTEMENERKTEVLEKIFSIFKDEEERKKEIKDYAKLDMKTVKMLKLFHEKMIPRVEDKVRAELKAEDAEKKDDENKDTKKADDKKKEERSASSLDKEPRIKFTSPNNDGKTDEERSASVPEIRNEVYLLRQKFLKGRQRS
jgi:hypothetical protein